MGDKNKGKTCKEAIKFWHEQDKENNIPETSEHVSLICQLPSLKKMDNKLNELVSCTHLSLSTNAIERLAPLTHLKKLKILSVGRNNIKKVEKLDDLGGHLEELWISYNLIEKLDGFANLHNLKVLFMSNNSLANFDELLKLRDLPLLEHILLLGNPFYEELSDAEQRIQVIKRLPNIKKLDGVMITSAERTAAKNAD